MPDTPSRTATVTPLTPLPTAMLGRPQRPAGSQRAGGPSSQQPIRDAEAAGAAKRAAGNGERQQLTAQQTIRHLATQHALTFNREEDLSLEELLADAEAIARYITDGTRDEPEPDPDSDAE